jgi:hypothetical protein
MKNQANSIFKKLCLILISSLAFTTSLFAGPPPPPTGVPIDDGLPYLLVGAILMGVYKIKKGIKSKDSTKDK